MSNTQNNTISIFLPVETLRDALTLIANAVNTRSQIPIYSHVYCRISPQGIRFSTCDGEAIEQRVAVPFSDNVSAECYNVGGDPVSDVGFTVPHKKLLDILKEFDSNLVAALSSDRKTNKAKLKVSGYRSSYSFLGLDETLYPSLDIDAPQTKAVISASNLLKLMTPIEGSMANNDVRYYLNGINLEKTGKDFFATATDGHRLSFNQVQASDASDVDARCTVPRLAYKAIPVFLKSMTSEANVVVAITDNHIVLKGEKKTFTSKLIDAKYPDARQVIPKQNSIIVEINRAALLNACKRTAILALEKFRGVTLGFSNDNPDALVIKSENKTKEKASEEVIIHRMEGLNSPLEIGLNVDYLINALTSLNDEVITIKLRDAESPALVHGESALLHVIMPMRT
ncbi:DNA polymerase III subunit beta [Alteromonas sp. 14N.309.X.WAT.G.H12]|uniref:DNA polymerase III subunit beta n=1 Tax=Alteromonas sp. 14N.309.X.WAT.G.H12 TaxID=3120824 RepID=UPI002FD16AEE